MMVDEKFLFMLHTAMDRVNEKYGTKKALCLFCGENEYDGEVGIKHDCSCPIVLLRELISSGTIEVSDKKMGPLERVHKTCLGRKC